MVTKEVFKSFSHEITFMKCDRQATSTIILLAQVDINLMV